MTDDTKPDYETARGFAELLIASNGGAASPDGMALARGFLASQAELEKERERGNALNARNGRMEGELSLLKPESAAKAAMETAYSDMKSGLAASQERVRELERGSPDDIRALGWSVAVHNDYRAEGKVHTFWLFTKEGQCVKGEGLTDAVAIEQVRRVLPDGTVIGESPLTAGDKP